MAKEASGKILLNIDPETHQQIIDLDASGAYKDVTTFCRLAINEKLEREEQGGKDGEISTLLNAYESLNDQGKAWLLTCARIAATSNETRIIVRRKRKESEPTDK